MTSPGNQTQRFYSSAAIDIIIRQAGGFPDPSSTDHRGDEERRSELEESLQFAAMTLAGTFVGRLVQRAQGRQQEEPRRCGRPAQVELQQFIEALQWIWLDVFDGRLRTSRDGESGESTGPQVHLLVACCRELSDALKTTSAALVVFAGRTRPRERQALIEALDKLTPNALEHRARRSSLPGLLRRLGDAPVDEPTPDDVQLADSIGKLDIDE